MACVTSVDVSKGSFYIYRTKGKLRAPERLLKLNHTPYGGLTSQGSTSPILALGSSSCKSKRFHLMKTKLYWNFKNLSYIFNGFLMQKIQQYYKYNSYSKFDFEIKTMILKVLCHQLLASSKVVVNIILVITSNLKRGLKRER